jgi:hypothetical protein
MIQEAYCDDSNLEHPNSQPNLNLNTNPESRTRNREPRWPPPLPVVHRSIEQARNR